MQGSVVQGKAKQDLQGPGKEVQDRIAHLIWRGGGGGGWVGDLCTTRLKLCKAGVTLSNLLHILCWIYFDE